MSTSGDYENGMSSPTDHMSVTKGLGGNALTASKPMEVSPNVLALLSHEQLQFAAEVVSNMSEALGITQIDVRVVAEEPEQGNRRVIAIDGSPNGQHLGTYNAIYARRQTEPDWYTVVVRGVSLDPLANTTDRAYRAMIEDAKLRDRPLPDSVALSHVSNELWTATMLTGEPLTEDGLIPLLSVNAESVDRVDFKPDRGGRSIRVRPSIVIATINEHATQG